MSEEERRWTRRGGVGGEVRGWGVRLEMMWAVSWAFSWVRVPVVWREWRMRERRWGRVTAGA